jgi:hypothetical protein
MSHDDHALIQSGIDRRLAAVESLIPSRPKWRSAGDQDIRPAVIRVVAGPALHHGLFGGRRVGLLVAVGAVILLMVGYGLLGGGGSRSNPPPSAATPTPSTGVTGEAGALRPAVEPRLIIPVRPKTAWTVVEDGLAYLSLVYLLDEVGAGGYNVGLAIFEPRGVYDPVDENKRLPLPADLIGWIHDHPDLEAAEPMELTVAGLPATAIDATVTYRAGGPKGQTVQFIDDGVGSWNLEFPSTKRFVLVHLPGGNLLFVFASRPEFFEANIGQFEDLLDGIAFEDGGPSP